MDGKKTALLLTFVIVKLLGEEKDVICCCYLFSKAGTLTDSLKLSMSSRGKYDEVPPKTETNNFFKTVDLN